MSEEDFTVAHMKAILAEHGQSLGPEAKTTYLDRPKPGQQHAVLVLERISDYGKGELPEYCTHGYASCVICEEPVFIGHASEQVLINREAYAICRQCAAQHIPKGSQPVRNVNDHRRADGPH